MTQRFLGDEVARGVERECAEDHALAVRVGEYRLEAETSKRGHNGCVERVKLLEEQLAKPKVDPFPKWLAPVWTLAAAGTSAAAGACLASGCPAELNVGLIVAAVLIDLGKVVFEILF